jgi:hypothetical protein
LRSATSDTLFLKRTTAVSFGNRASPYNNPLLFVIPTEAKRSGGDLGFYGPFMEMFFDRATRDFLPTRYGDQGAVEKPNVVTL